MIMMTDYSD